MLLVQYLKLLGFNSPCLTSFIVRRCSLITRSTSDHGRSGQCSFHPFPENVLLPYRKPASTISVSIASCIVGCHLWIESVSPLGSIALIVFLAFVAYTTLACLTHGAKRTHSMRYTRCPSFIDLASQSLSNARTPPPTPDTQGLRPRTCRNCRAAVRCAKKRPTSCVPFGE